MRAGFSTHNLQAHCVDVGLPCQRPLGNGSGAIVVIGSVGEEDALAEQVRFRAPATVTLSRISRPATSALAFPSRPAPGRSPGPAGRVYGDARSTQRLTSSRNPRPARPVRGCPSKADGAHRPSWRPDAVRYMSVDTAT